MTERTLPRCRHCAGPVVKETPTNVLPRGVFLARHDKKHHFCSMRCGFLWAVERVEAKQK